MRDINVSLPHTASPGDLRSNKDSHSKGRFLIIIKNDYLLLINFNGCGTLELEGALLTSCVTISQSSTPRLHIARHGHQFSGRF